MKLAALFVTALFCLQQGFSAAEEPESHSTSCAPNIDGTDISLTNRTPPGMIRCITKSVCCKRPTHCCFGALYCCHHGLVTGPGIPC